MSSADLVGILGGILSRGVAQLVARTAGGREVASSSLVTPTRNASLAYVGYF